jgi:hypothetical protein
MADWFSHYVALLKVLHKNKVIDIEDVIVELGNTIDFAKSSHMDVDLNQERNIAVYKSLQQISHALDQAESKIRKSRTNEE